MITTVKELLEFVDGLRNGTNVTVLYGIELPRTKFAKGFKDLNIYKEVKVEKRVGVVYDNMQAIKDYKAEREQQGNPVVDNRNMDDYETLCDGKVKRKISTGQYYFVFEIGSAKNKGISTAKSTYYDRTNGQNKLIGGKDEFLKDYGDKLTPSQLKQLTTPPDEHKISYIWVKFDNVFEINGTAIRIPPITATP